MCMLYVCVSVVCVYHFVELPFPVYHAWGLVVRVAVTHNIPSTGYTVGETYSMFII